MDVNCNSLSLKRISSSTSGYKLYEFLLSCYSVYIVLVFPRSTNIIVKKIIWLRVQGHSGTASIVWTVCWASCIPYKSNVWNMQLWRTNKMEPDWTLGPAISHYHLALDHIVEDESNGRKNLIEVRKLRYDYWLAPIWTHCSINIRLKIIYYNFKRNEI